MACGVSFEAEIECGLICAPLIHVVAAVVAPAEMIAAVVAAMIADFIGRSPLVRCATCCLNRDLEWLD
jgi:hypothetical protein